MAGREAALSDVVRDAKMLFKEVVDLATRNAERPANTLRVQLRVCQVGINISSGNFETRSRYRQLRLNYLVLRRLHHRGNESGYRLRNDGLLGKAQAGQIVLRLQKKFF